MILLDFCLVHLLPSLRTSQPRLRQCIFIFPSVKCAGSGRTNACVSSSIDHGGEVCSSVCVDSAANLDLGYFSHRWTSASTPLKWVPLTTGNENHIGDGCYAVERRWVVRRRSCATYDKISTSLAISTQGSDSTCVVRGGWVERIGIWKYSSSKIEENQQNAPAKQAAADILYWNRGFRVSCTWTGSRSWRCVNRIWGSPYSESRSGTPLWIGPRYTTFAKGFTL